MYINNGATAILCLPSEDAFNRMSVSGYIRDQEQNARQISRDLRGENLNCIDFVTLATLYDLT